MALFREHLKPSSTFYRFDQLQQVIEQSKAATLDKMTEGVRIFDTKRVTCLATDWSDKGIGFWLLQKFCTCEVIFPVYCSTGWEIVFAGSRFTHPAESKYTIEGEALTVNYVLDSARHFVLGCDNLVVASDLKPLLGVSLIFSRRFCRLSLRKMCSRTSAHVTAWMSLDYCRSNDKHFFQISLCVGFPRQGGLRWTETRFNTSDGVRLLEIAIQGRFFCITREVPHRKDQARRS